MSNDNSSHSNNDQKAPAVSWRFKGSQGATPWKESYVESTAQDATVTPSEHTKPLEWTHAQGGGESTHPYTIDPQALAVTGHTKPLEWTSSLGGLQSIRPHTADTQTLEPFEHAKPLLLTDLAQGWEAIKPMEVSPAMASALNQSAALSLEGSAQQLLQAMAGFAPSAMGIAAATPDQVALWRQEIAVGLSS